MDRGGTYELGWKRRAGDPGRGDRPAWGTTLSRGTRGDHACADRAGRRPDHRHLPLRAAGAAGDLPVRRRAGRGRPSRSRRQRSRPAGWRWPSRRAAPAGSRRPYLVVAGLALSFSLFTLLGTLVLAALPVPQDVIRWAGLVLLVLLGIGHDRAAGGAAAGAAVRPDPAPRRRHRPRLVRARPRARRRVRPVRRAGARGDHGRRRDRPDRRRDRRADRRVRDRHRAAAAGLRAGRAAAGRAAAGVPPAPERDPGRRRASS